ncbi:MAG: GlxA family transcriptional regulator [Dokdonella sp.]
MSTTNRDVSRAPASSEKKATALMTQARTRRVVLLAYEQMNLLDLSGPLQALVTANRAYTSDAPGLYETIVASMEGGLVVTNSGLSVMTGGVSALDGIAIDTLIVPGGCGGNEYVAPSALVSWIAQRAPSVRRVCSVCTGAFMLAAAGLLEGRCIATHWDWVSRFSQLHPSIAVDANRIFIQDGPVWTSAGVTAGIDLTLALIESDFGHKVAIETARQLVMFVKRSGGQSQYSVSLSAQSRGSDRFGDLHAWIADNLCENLSVERLAAEVDMSPRTFARAYAEKLGRTPAKAVESMRLEAACRSLEETTQPLKAIAASTGYVDEQTLRRVFKRILGVSPSEYRSRFSAHDFADAQASL